VFKKDDLVNIPEAAWENLQEMISIEISREKIAKKIREIRNDQWYHTTITERHG
jgi:hypothetical protein